MREKSSLYTINLYIIYEKLTSCPNFVKINFQIKITIIFTNDKQINLFFNFYLNFEKNTFLNKKLKIHMLLFMILVSIGHLGLAG